MENVALPQFHLETHPKADPQAMVILPQTRFTVLTPRLIRMEYSPLGVFEDRPSQVFWLRQQPVPDFQVWAVGKGVEITSQYLHLRYAGGPFTPGSLSVELRNEGVSWHYGNADDRNLGGTARTLDEVSGQTRLEAGLLSRSGWSLVDDSKSLLFNTQGWLEPRQADPEAQDLYFFGYGTAYQDCLEDFQRVSGHVPVLPRWALGNWWSRYWAYSQKELTGLMQEFKTHQTPLSVCIIDMDWHLEGWTGYSWNRDLIPDPDGFLQELHAQGLKTALNLHPADGVGPHETQYAQMAEAMGVDPASQQPVGFNLEDRHFAEAYFNLLHHPMEKQGVDFWWMDWQQGNPSALAGLNLLWWINHLHFHDLGRDGSKRRFVFSRWGGLGNHRYPIGFSGDTIVNWKSLAFQPYFTATAANVCFGWWSHDIGGHMNGIEDPELYTRWVQFGVFSPILRLHSTKNAYHERRPWGYDADTSRITQRTMQLRHALIPYLYSMSWRNHEEGTSLIRPMYHSYPEVEEAYACPNQYTFGSELIAAPYTSPRDADTRLSRQVVWFPEGEWYDFFSGQSVKGGGWQACYGPMDEIPVFAKAGAIIPLGSMQGWGGGENPPELTVHVFPGASNRFVLYEDDSVSEAYRRGVYATTSLCLDWNENELTFRIEPACGDASLLLPERTFSLVFKSIQSPEKIEVLLNGALMAANISYDSQTHTLTLSGLQMSPQDNLQIGLKTQQASLAYRSDPTLSMLRKILKAFRMGNWAKKAIDACLKDIQSEPACLARYLAVMSKSQVRAFLEVIAECGLEHITTAGEELIILWNNRKNTNFRYVVSEERTRIYDMNYRFAAEQGSVPEFLLFRPASQWKGSVLLETSYQDLIKIVLTHQVDDLYPHPKPGIY